MLFTCSSFLSADMTAAADDASETTEVTTNEKGEKLDENYDQS